MTGQGLVLNINGQNFAAAGGNVEYAASVKNGDSYALTVSTQPSLPTQVCSFTTGGSGVVSQSLVEFTLQCNAPGNFAISGTTTGYAGSGLQLQINGGEILAVTGSNFAFVNAINDGGQYNVQVKVQPTSPVQICTPQQNVGIVTGAAVTNISINCSTVPYSVGGYVNGLTGSGLKLQINGGQTLARSVDGFFLFGNPLADLTAFDVTVSEQPTGQTCSVSQGFGIVNGSGVYSTVVQCAAQAYSVSGLLSGLSGGSVTLVTSAGEFKALNTNGTFSLSQPFAQGANYIVEIFRQPTTPAQTCTVYNSTGTIAGANVTNVSVNCATNGYTVGGSGTVTGLSSNGLVLRLNNAVDLALPATANSFVFSTLPLADLSAYTVSVAAQPNGLKCSLNSTANGTIAAANVNNVVVNCVPGYTVSGTVAGQLGTNLVIRNVVNGQAKDYVFVGSSYTFPDSLATGDTYSVSIYNHPESPYQNCVFDNALTTQTGTVALANIAINNITCTSVNIAFAAASSSVGEAGPNPNLTLNITPQSPRAATVQVIATNVSASAGFDFSLASTTISIPANTSSVTLPVTIIQDSLIEGNEVAQFSLSSPVGINLGAQSAHTLTIIDDDGVLPTFTSLALANAASDGYVNLSERSLATALGGTLTAANYTAVTYKLVSSATLCNGSLTYGPMPAANSADFGSDGSYRICVRLSDAASNYVYGSSAAINLDATVPAFTSLALINAAGDGYVNLSERSLATALAGTLTASGYDTADYKLVAAATTCNGSLTYGAMPNANSVDFGGDGNYKICVRLTDNAGNPPAYGSSATIVLDATAPAFTSLILANAATDGYINATERSLATAVGGTLTASGYDSVAYKLVAAATTCNGSLTYGAMPNANSADFTSDGNYKICVQLTDLAGNTTAYGNSGTIALDTTAPTVSSLNSVTANGSYGQGSVIDITVNFSEPVTLAGGNLVVSLTNGGSTSITPFGPASSGSANYTIAASQNTADLTATSPLTLSAGTLKDAAGNNGVLTIPSGFNLGDNKNIVVDTNAPVLVSAQTMDANGNGKIDYFKLTFDKPVNDSTFPGYALNAVGTATTQWLIAGYTNVQLAHGTAAPVADTANDTVLYLKFTETGSIGDTGAKPDLTTTASPALKDTLGNTIAQVATVSVTESDGALPVILSALGTSATSTLVINFSEAVYPTSTPGCPNTFAATAFVYANLGTGGVSALASAGGWSDANGCDSQMIMAGNGNFASGDFTPTPDKIGAAASAVYDGAGNAMATTQVNIVQNSDVTAPTVLSSTPADTATLVAPCSGNPCTGKIVVVFSESMNSSLNQTLTTEVWDASPNTPLYVSVPNTNTTFAWSTTTSANDTLTVNISWIWFPENAQLRWTLATSGLKDLAGNAIAAQVQRTFTTTTAKVGRTVGDTGQTLCYNDTVSQACGDTVNWPRQDGDFANTPAGRNMVGPTQYLATTDYTTTDTVTGLTWRSCAEGKTGATCATGSTVQAWWPNMVNACSAYNVANSGAGFGGKTNWRLTTMLELMTLVNYGLVNPSLETSAFPSTVANQTVTSTLSLSAAGEVKGLGFGTGGGQTNDGAISKNNGATNTYDYRCVAGGSTPAAPSYTDNGDGTVTDNNANLRWQKCSMGQNNDATCTGTATTTTVQAALQYCRDLTLAAKSWRLPSVRELESLLNYKSAPSIDATFFPATAQNYYHSSSSHVVTTANIWGVHFGSALVNNGAKTGAYWVRCVTNGP